MLRVVIDPNVFVSAVISPNGVPGQVADATAADVLVSGDRDLADAALVTGVVMTPRAFLDELTS